MKDKTLKQFSDLLASKEPIPGGGGGSALVACLAASLAQMVCNLTIGKTKYLSYAEELTVIRNEMDILRNELLNCIDKDAQAFEPLSKAYSLDKNDPNYEETIEQCLKDAAEPPLSILKYCTRIIELDERLEQIGSKIIISDAATSVMLAQGALYGAFINIQANTRLMKDRDYADKLDQTAKKLLKEYSQRSLICFDKISERIMYNG